MAKENFLIIEDSNERIVYHGLTGGIFLLNKDLEVDFNELSKHIRDKKEIAVERKCESSDRLYHLIFNVSEMCNMKCRYCYAGEGEYGSSGILMSQQIAKEAIDHIYHYFQKGVDRISFFGGEPFISIELIKYIVKYTGEICEKNGIVKPRYDTISNGTLLTEKNIEFVAKYFNNITISIDGPQIIQDKVRTMKDDSGSYERVCQSVNWLKNQGVVLNAAMVINQVHLEEYKKGNGNLIEWKKELYDLGFDYVSYGVVQTSQKSLKIEDEEKYFELIREDVRYELECLLKGKNINHFANKYYTILYGILAKKHSAECNCGMRQIFVTATGEYYPCQFFYNNKADKIGCIGKINEAVRENVQNTYLRDNVTKCKKCYLSKVCTAWCPGTAYEMGQTYNYADDITCKTQKVMFSETLKFVVGLKKNKEQYKQFLKNLKIYIADVENDFGREEHIY